MGRTACTEPQCLYKGDLYLYFLQTHRAKTEAGSSVRTAFSLFVKISLYSNKVPFNPLNSELNPICYQLELLGAHPILHISRIRINTT